MRRRWRREEGRWYDLGRHLLQLRKDEEGWTVSVDGLGREQRYATEPEAWSAGVAAADLLDRFTDHPNG